eukprot:TRINITY_DN35559_c0_g1_i1.p1 TRINITY_DN35559_c0_g1~~TRINITY_DN35559_c0_g1_i1.p1  ORF type:complete len:344 (+),score=73.92 TRINITY_DN35559_c0_g1_i1:135-1166(+)
MAIAPPSHVTRYDNLERTSRSQPQEKVSYAEALQERLQRVRAELDVQGQGVLALRQSVDSSQEELRANQQELSDLRHTWAAQKSQRAALLKEAGERERELAERERCVAEALALHAVAQMSASESGVPPASSAAVASEGIAGDATMRPPSSGRPTFDTARDREKDRQQKLKMSQLEETRMKLTAALHEMREAVKQEEVEVEQSRARNEVLKKESRALRAGADAAVEGEAKMLAKLREVDALVLAAQQKHKAAEKQVAEVMAEVEGLRVEQRSQTALAEANVAQRSAQAVAKPAKIVGSSGAPGSGIDITNTRLQTKVVSLEEDLCRKQSHLAALKQRLEARTAS